MPLPIVPAPQTQMELMVIAKKLFVKISLASVRWNGHRRVYDKFLILLQSFYASRSNDRLYIAATAAAPERICHQDTLDRYFRDRPALICASFRRVEVQTAKTKGNL